MRTRLFIFCLPLLWACEARLRALAQTCQTDDDCKSGYSCDLGTGRCEVQTGGPCTEGQIACSRDQGACKAGQRRCVRGMWSECSGVVSTREVCNLVDDDCDGVVDEDFPTLGDACSEGRGSCLTAGVQVCREDGSAAFCNAVAIPPSPETCNNLDDDCDGVIDNAIVSAPACPLSLGVCAGSRQTCLGTDFVSCSTASYGPAYEAADDENLCDGLDNDCDGSVDEGYALRVGDIRISEVVSCPIQAWCDAATCGTGVNAPGGNGVAFDALPGVVDLTANVANHVWIELHNQRSCDLPLAGVSVAAGLVGSLSDVLLSATTAVTPSGAACTSLPPNGYCLVKAPAALLGDDNVSFSRRAQVKIDGLVIDTFDISDPNGCASSCRTLSTRRAAASPCCEQEAYVRTSTGVVKGTATPFLPASVTLEYTLALPSEVVVSEVLAAPGVDVNGDGTADADEDAFVEIAALQNVSLGRASLEHNGSGSAARVHDFACFVPLQAGARLAVFGGLRSTLPAASEVPPSNALSFASTTPRDFALPRATDLLVRLKDRSGNELGRAEVAAADAPLAGTQQSRTSCGLGENDLSSACECFCAGEPAACVPECDASCESAPSVQFGCFSPGTVK